MRMNLNAVALVCLASGVAVGGEPTVVVYTNAAVYTVNPDMPWADAVAFDGNVIIAVGNEADVLAAAGSSYKLCDLGGLMVIPGFHDVHTHTLEAGVNADMCFLPPFRSLNFYANRVATCASQDGGVGWVRAAGASLDKLSFGATLPVDFLDNAVPNRPVIVIDYLGHAVWTNSLGLAAAGIDANTPDPQGGIIGRAPDGRLTGILYEDAQQILRDAAAFTQEEYYQGLLVSLGELASNGITSVSDVGGYWTRGDHLAWGQALAEGTLTARASNALYVYPGLDMNDQLATLGGLFSNDPNSLLRFNTAKMYTDGIFDYGTAAMIAPYNTAPNPDWPSGFPYFEQATLEALSVALHQIGFQIAYHTIGDDGVRMALDAVEAIHQIDPNAGDRHHRTTHNYLIANVDRARFAQLGVTADFQLSPDSIDPGYASYLFQFIGLRSSQMLPLGSMISAGAHTTLSSDWDAGPLSPLGTIERGLRRQSEGIADLATAIELHTINGAEVLNQADLVGSIEIGKLADLVVLSRNLFDIPVTQIDETRVILTIVDGAEVYRSADADALISCATACSADLNGDGALNFFDISAFLGAFAKGNPVADFTNDGLFNFFDVSVFLQAFNAGCP
ncbi:MAG: amidohydrolase [Phycisphaerales bacterium]|nr:amidohydrolase [Phycisphaerales bacterium]